MSDNTTPHAANGYDSGVTGTLPYYNAFHDETMHLIRSMDRNPHSWLDTGCGTGTLVEKALGAFPQTIFHLADPSDAMLEQAKRKLAHRDSQRVHFLKPMDTSELPGELDGTFDVVTAIQSHHYLDRIGREQATRRSLALLKPGGLFITFENTRPRTREGTEIARNYWRQFHLDQGMDPAFVDRQVSRFDVAYFPITIDEHIAMLQQAGFRTVELLWHSYMQSGFYCIKQV